MGRLPRIAASDLHYHVIVRCNNQEFYFEDDADFERYLNTLRRIQKKHDFKLFNYELMNSHVHLFLQPSEKFPLPKTMMLINWKFARIMNKIKKRKGHFWLDRYKCIPVQADEYALTLMRYINRNPVRAKMVDNCGDWKWSGYHYYAHGIPNDLITPHPLYLDLSKHPEKRKTEYANFVNTLMDHEKDLRLPAMSAAPFIGNKKFERLLMKNGFLEK